MSVHRVYYIFRVWEVPAYDSGPKTGYPEGFRGFCKSIRKKVDKIWPTPNMATATSYHIRGLLEKYPTFGREKETGLLGALDT